MAASDPRPDETLPELDADWELLARAALGRDSVAGGAGADDAFAALVERHQERVVRLCTHWLGDREAGQDAAQEVFLKAFRHAGSVEPRGRFYTWLYRVAVNHCLNQLRRRRIARFFSLQGMRTAGDRAAGDADLEFDPADGAPGAERIVLARERWRTTRERLDALPESQRVVLLLAKFEGLSGREIAETLGITEGAVESRLVRAMRRLTAQEEPEERVSSPGERSNESASDAGG
ncbi:MAG: RNA polymerase sigma factor [Thermoanaerobaculia bacterium]